VRFAPQASERFRSLPQSNLMWRMQRMTFAPMSRECLENPCPERAELKSTNRLLR